MTFEYNNSNKYNIDLGKLNKSLFSVESLNAKDFIYEERSLEAIRLTEDEFKAQLPKIKEQLSKFYDDFKKNLEQKIEIEFNKNVREKLIKQSKKDPKNTIPPDKVLADLKAALQMTKKQDFIDSFIKEVTSRNDPNRDKNSQCVLAEFNPVKMVNLNKHGAVAAGLVLAIVGCVSIGISMAVAVGSMILAAIFTSIGVGASEKINEKQYKKTDKENMKLDGKKMFKVKRKQVDIKSDAIYSYKIIYYLKPKIKIKKTKEKNTEN